ncbi:MAG: hypothetical protein PHF50_01250 [Patescibacteria group bacterium]|nr:hypothetical protein [Patescibacteria group bacterium]
MKSWTKILVAAAVAVVILLISFNATAGEKVVYTIKKGDTLGELMYTWRVQGVDINKLHIWNADLGTQVKVGQKITYFLPESTDVKKLTDQEIQKVVAETIARMEKSKEPSAAQKAPKQQQVEPIFPKYVQVFGSVVLALIFVALLVNAYYSSKKAKSQTQAPAAKKRVTIPLEKNGLFETEIEWDEATGRWLTPFRHLSGGDRMWGKDEGSARRSAQKCWRDAVTYNEQIGELIAQGIIREKNKKQATA